MTQLSIPLSILDTDLYKISMQQAALHHYPKVNASYKFQNRNPDTKWKKETIDSVRDALQNFSTISLQPDERRYLEAACPYLTTDYLNYLEAYRFKPEEVTLTFIPDTPEDPSSSGDLEISISGPWHSTILWEVPLMATLSETYFLFQDTDWSLDGQDDQALMKGKALLEAGCAISEFGTRRRRSFTTQDIAVAGLVHARDELQDKEGSGILTGTSNVYLAKKHNLKPIGTIAHEWFMGIAAINGYEDANPLGLRLWEQVYPQPGVLRTALTDTFTSDVFFKDMIANPEVLDSFPSLRQDSGDPFAFAPRAAKVFQQLGMDSKDKTIVYSDSLTPEKTVKLHKHCTEEIGMKAAFGIGTNLTNDFAKKSDPSTKSKALNIVIKISTVDGKGCVKISDDLTKNTGRPEDIEYVKKLFGIPKQ